MDLHDEHVRPRVVHAMGPLACARAMRPGYQRAVEGITCAVCRRLLGL